MESIDIKPYEIKKVQKIVESKETDALLECLQSLEMHAETIGEGGNAEIFALAEGPFSKVCLKRIKETPQIICNDIDRENELQGKARRAGVRTPLALISFETLDGKKYFIMEKIIGSTIEEILVDPSKLPDGFSVEVFNGDIEEQVRKLHTAEIYHRDLHTRNVMVNEEGLPVIIDFGTAVEGTGSDNTYQEYANKYNPITGRYEPVEGMFKDDKMMLRNLKSALAPIGLQQALTRKINSYNMPNSMTMLIDEQFKEIVQKKYEEAISKNETSILLYEEKLGGMMLFIDTEPKHYLMSFEIDGKKLYVGSETITATS